MSRSKGSKNKIQSGITYPRKCETCDYISNNPSMFHYHKKTHLPVIGQVCHKCNNPAVVVSTMGIYRCNENPHLCPVYLEEHSARIEDQWKDDEDRRTATRTSTIERFQTEENYKKVSAGKRYKTGLLTEEKRKDFRKYARACRSLAQLWAKDNGHAIGRQTFHVDHIFSVLDGFTLGVEPAIVSHPENLRILAAKVNSSKGRTSEMTLQQLLEKINVYRMAHSDS